MESLMETLAVVAFLVTCSSDLLNCQTLNTDQLSWRNPERCQSEIGRMIGNYERQGYANVMGKCQYVIPDEKYRSYPIG
jgi:hypothetical protein